MIAQGKQEALPRASKSAVRRAMLLVLLASLTLTMAFGLLYRFRASPLLLEADEREYYDLASALMAGELPMLGRRTLGFPLLIAAIRSVADSIWAVQIVVATLYSFSAPLLLVLVRRLTGSLSAGIAAGLALAAWPPALFYGSSLYSETAALPAFLLSLALLPPGPRVRRQGLKAAWIAFLAAGLVLGLTTHIRPMYLLFLPFLALCLLLEQRRFATAAASFTLALLGFLIVILPWSGYVSARLGHFVLVTANGGETLAGALTPVLLDPALNIPVDVHDRDVWIGPGKWLPIERNGYLSGAEQTLPYAAKDALLRTRAVAWTKANPLQAAQLEGAKIAYMWGVYPLMRNGMRQFLFGNVPTIALVLVAVALGLRRPRGESLARLWLLPLFVSFVALVSWGSWRFRQPGDAGLLAFVVAAVICDGRWRARQDRADPLDPRNGEGGYLPAISLSSAAA